MKKGLSKAILQPAFREDELKSASRFIDYCKDNGMLTSREELEHLHKEGLLYPAVKIYYGIARFKKIFANYNGTDQWIYVNFGDVKKFKPKKVEKQTYYSSIGGFGGNDGWLKYFEDKEMVEYPAQEKFRAWKKESFHPDFVTNYRLIEKECEYFYDKIQLLSLKVVKKERSLWQQLNNEKLKKELIKSTKRYLENINEFLKVYIEIEKLINDAFEDRNEQISKIRRDFMHDEKEISYEWKSAFEITFLPKYKILSQNILKKYSFNQEKIERWIRFFEQQSIFHESNRSSKCIRTYLRHISERDLVDAEDTNYMILVLNQFLYFINGELKTLKQTLLDSFLPVCIICGKMYTPRNKSQKTCADLKCIAENKNRSKRKKK